MFNVDYNLPTLTTKFMGLIPHWTMNSEIFPRLEDSHPSISGPQKWMIKRVIKLRTTGIHKKI